VAGGRKITVGQNRMTVVDPELQIEFEVYGFPSLVEGLGKVLGRDMYFHAKYDDWFFEVADRNGNMPSDGFFDSDGFYQEARYRDPGGLPLEEAVRIIEDCLRLYLQTRS